MIISSPSDTPSNTGLMELGALKLIQPEPEFIMWSFA